jgi:hypothetical protein
MYVSAPALGGAASLPAPILGRRHGGDPLRSTPKARPRQEPLMPSLDITGTPPTARVRRRRAKTPVIERPTAVSRPVVDERAADTSGAHAGTREPARPASPAGRAARVGAGRTDSPAHTRTRAPAKGLGASIESASAALPIPHLHLAMTNVSEDLIRHLRTEPDTPTLDAAYDRHWTRDRSWRAVGGTVAACTAKLRALQATQVARPDLLRRERKSAASGSARALRLVGTLPDRSPR